MPNARFAEFLLRRATTPERASAIVGDLLEQHPHQPLRFATALARVILSLQWRQLLGFAAAAISFLLPAIAFTRMALRYVTPLVERHERFKITASAAPLLLGCMGLMAVGAFALAKPSTRRIAAMSLLLAMTDFVAACSIYIHPVTHQYSLIIALGVALLLIAIPATRRATLISLAATTVLSFTAFMVVGLATQLLHPHGRYILRYDLGISALAWLTAIAAGIATLNALQRRFVPTITTPAS
jgi:hypothetical protein